MPDGYQAMGLRLYHCPCCHLIFSSVEEPLRSTGSALAGDCARIACPTPRCEGTVLLRWRYVEPPGWVEAICAIGLGLAIALLTDSLGHSASVVLLVSFGIAVTLWAWPILRGRLRPDRGRSVAAEQTARRGLALEERGDDWCARFAYECALRLLRPGTCPRQEGTILGFLAVLEQREQRHGPSFEHLDRAIELARKTGDAKTQIVRYNNMSFGLAAHLARHAEALEFLDEAVRVARECDARPELVRLLAQRGWSRLVLGDVTAASTDVHEAWRLADAARDPEGYYRAVIVRCELKAHRGDRDEALRDLQSLSVTYWRWLNKPSLRFLARVRWDLAESPVPLTLPIPARLQLSTRALSDPAARERVKTAIRTSGSLEDRERRLYLAAARAQEMGLHLEYRFLCLDLGAVYCRRGRTDEALRCLTQAAARASEPCETEIECAALLFRGEVRRMRGEWQEAREDLEAVHAYASSCGHLQIGGLALVSAGRLHCDLGAWDMAGARFDKAQRIADEADVPRAEAPTWDTSVLRGAVHQNRGDWFSRRAQCGEALSEYRMALQIGLVGQHDDIARAAFHSLGIGLMRSAEVERNPKIGVDLLREAEDAVRRSLEQGHCAPGLPGAPLCADEDETLLAPMRRMSLSRVLLNLGRHVEAVEQFAIAEAEASTQGQLGADLALGTLQCGALQAYLGIAEGPRRILDAATRQQSVFAAISTLASERSLLRFLTWSRASWSCALSLLVTNGPWSRDGEVIRACADMVLSRKGSAAEALRLQRAKKKDATLGPVVVAEILRALPVGTVLLDFVRFRRWTFECPTLWSRWAEERYAVFVLPARDGDVAFVDLGVAEHVDDAIRTTRELLSSLGATEETAPECALKELGTRALDMVPEGTRRVIVCPDSNLASLPFEIVQTEGGELWVDRFEDIAYITSGRDLLREVDGDSAPTKPLVVGAPDFDLGLHHRTPDLDEPQRPCELRGLLGAFRPLGETREAVARVARLLDVEPLLGNMALDATVKSAVSPEIVHIVSHGFHATKPDDTEDAHGFWSEPGNVEWMRGSNPLLYSGIALAGANAWIAGGASVDQAEDGLLLADDVVSMKLGGTRLAVLAACWSGAGAASHGEGIFGLRRAFAVAGAHYLVVSLWQIPERPANDMAEELYRLYREYGGDVSRAFREARRKVRIAHADPLNWAGTILQLNVGGGRRLNAGGGILRTQSATADSSDTAGDSPSRSGCP